MRFTVSVVICVAPSPPIPLSHVCLLLRLPDYTYRAKKDKPSTVMLCRVQLSPSCPSPKPTQYTKYAHAFPHLPLNPPPKNRCQKSKKTQKQKLTATLYRVAGVETPLGVFDRFNNRNYKAHHMAPNRGRTNVLALGGSDCGILIAFPAPARLANLLERLLVLRNYIGR
jgi:hypothetical protein